MNLEIIQFIKEKFTKIASLPRRTYLYINKLYMLKKCNDCGIEKDISNFKKHTSTADRKSNFCDECNNRRQREYRKEVKNICTTKYEKTEKGFLVRLYRNMKSRITGVQKQKFYLYEGKELLDKEDFYKWALSNDDFKTLFNTYKENGYKRTLAPSVDRINSQIGYIISNMEFVTHSENSRRGNLKKNK